MPVFFSFFLAKFTRCADYFFSLFFLSFFLNNEDVWRIFSSVVLPSVLYVLCVCCYARCS